MSLISLVADARALPLPDDSVDLVCTSPPYWAQRSYTDGGEAYAGQLGAEPTPAGYLDALLDATAEWCRVLKPDGNLWVNLGDKWATRWGSSRPQGRRGMDRLDGDVDRGRGRWGRNSTGVPEKSLVGLPWRYALGCVDELGLTLRAEVVWDKPNGLPESVTDRVRRSHETWFHLTLGRVHYAAIDRVREPHVTPPRPRQIRHRTAYHETVTDTTGWRETEGEHHPLGRLPGSVWTVPTEPLDLPAGLTGDGDDHYASFPAELPRRIVEGWSPERVCAACGQGLRPVLDKVRTVDGRPAPGTGSVWGPGGRIVTRNAGIGNWRVGVAARDLGEACGCDTGCGDTTPGVVLDPLGGTGTTAQVAHALGRVGISADLSAGYARIAADDTLARRRRAKVHGLPAPAWAPPGAPTLFDG